MDKKDKTCVIFGCSERILGIQSRIPELMSEYDSIGLNAFPLYYPSKYWLWIDNPDKGNCVYINDNGSYKKYLQFTPNLDLHGAYTVASFALDFAVKQGYQKAILYGILDGEYQYSGNPYTHAGHMEFSYRHFYDLEPGTVLMQKLQQFKAIILSYGDKIKLEIPYKSI